MKIIKSTLSLLATGLLISCGGDSFSKADASAAQAAAVGALTTAVGAAGSGGLTAEQTANISVDYTGDCAGGGTVKVVGEWSGASAGAVASVYYDIQATFVGCNDGNVTMDGNLKYVTGINAAAGGASVNFVLKGNVVYSGSIVGDCEFDVEINASSSAAGGSASGSGSICGQDFAGGVAG